MWNELLAAQGIAPGVMIGSWIFIVVLSIWSIIWKGIALWKCGRNNHLVWFVFILILNTAGILPIVYLLFFQKKAAKKVAVKKPAKKK